MATWTYPAGEQPKVKLRDCSGDLTIQVWDEPAIEIISDGEDEDLHRATEQNGEEIRITDLDDDLRLRLPRAAQVEIEDHAGSAAIEGIAAARLVDIAGDVVLRSIAGDVELEEVSGDLVLEGAGRVIGRREIGGDTRIAEAGSLDLKWVGGDLRVSGVPTVQIGEVSGDTVVAGATERCALGRIGGDLTLHNSGPSTISQVDGDLNAEGVRGLEAGAVRGDARVRLEEGAVSIGHVSGDLKARLAGAPLKVSRVSGDAVVEGAASLELGHVGGDLDLRLSETGENSYRANVGGDAMIRVEDEPNLVLQAVVKGDISGVGAAGGLRMRHGPIKVTYGSGAARLELVVGGDLVVRGAGEAAAADWSTGWGAFAEEMAQLGREMAEMGREIAASIGAEFGARAGGRRHRHPKWHHRHPVPPVPPVPPAPPRVHIDREHLERIKEQARQAAQEGIARAQEAVERALREVRAHHAGEKSDRPSGPATEPTVDLSREERREPPSDEERLAILRMLQEGRITPEEADLLLAALD